MRQRAWRRSTPGCGGKRRHAALALLIVALTGCGGPGQPSSGPAPAAPGGEEAAGFPVRVENCGRMLEFTEPPSRVVAGYLPAFETLAALGAGDRLIGRTRADELGLDDFLPCQRELYEAAPEISDSIALPSKEVLLSMDRLGVFDTVLGLIPGSPAAQQRRVLPVFPASYPGYRTFAAIRQIAAFLHPDAFGGA